MPGGTTYRELKALMRGAKLHTVCEEARCPNIGDCWERKSATFMILGNICTRRCHYCAVTTGRPGGVDVGEPERLARIVERMGLNYCVITSVNRDDLGDGGAFIFSLCIKLIRAYSPNCKVEVLIPDFAGNVWALKKLIKAKPDVLNHNLETSKRIFKKVRPKGDYKRSLELLALSKELDRNIPTKSGIMIGLGEDFDEIVETMEDLRSHGCDLLTIGQYLRPSQKHWPISKFYKPSEFDELKRIGTDMGFKHVAAGPLVRSSYHADEQHLAAKI
jgi:lipoic acid synthetase